MLQLMVTCISRALFTSHPLVWGHDFFFLIPKTQLLSDDLESYTCYQSLLYYPEPPAQMLGLPSSQPPSSFALTVRILFPAPLLAVCWPVMTTPPHLPHTDSDLPAWVSPALHHRSYAMVPRSYT